MNLLTRIRDRLTKTSTAAAAPPAEPTVTDPDAEFRQWLREHGTVIAAISGDPEWTRAAVRVTAEYIVDPRQLHEQREENATDIDEA